MKVTIQSNALAKEILSYPLSIIKESTSHFQRKCKSTENILILGKGKFINFLLNLRE